MPAGLVGAGVIAGAAGVVGAGVSAYGSITAADTQANAARNATNAEVGMFTQTSNNLAPFVQSGNAANDALLQGLALPAPALTDAQRTQAFVALRNKYGGDDAQAGAEFNARMAQGPAAFADLIPGLATPDTSSMAKGSLTKPFTAADFQSSPGYNFALSQGLDTIQNKASTGFGGGVGGNMLKDLMTYG